MPSNRAQEDEYLYDMARPWHGAANAPAPRIVGGKAPLAGLALSRLTTIGAVGVMALVALVGWVIAQVRGR